MPLSPIPGIDVGVVDAPSFRDALRVTERTLFLVDVDVVECGVCRA